MDLNGELARPRRLAAAKPPGFVSTQTGIEAMHPPDTDGNKMDYMLLAQDEERLRMGRELHDSTGQLVLALRLGIAHLKQVHGTRAENAALADIEETASQIDQEIRSFSFTHYPATVGDQGLAEALRCLVRGVRSRTGLRIKFTDNCQGGIANGLVEVALLRVAQEALANVQRHSGAEHARVNLATKHDIIELSIRDDGKGISPEFENGSVSGVGLQGMRHRIERLGGMFSVRRLKRGTRILARVPIPA